MLIYQRVIGKPSESISMGHLYHGKMLNSQRVICFTHMIGSGWWYTYPSGKYESVGMMKIPMPNIWKNKSHVPNHQPDMIGYNRDIIGIFHGIS